MAKILVSHQPIFIPLIRQLVDLGHEIISIAPQFTKQLRDSDLPCHSLGEFSTPDLGQEAANQAARFVDLAHNPIDTRGLNGKVAEWLETDYMGFIYQKLFDVCLLVELTNAIEPDLILVHNDVEPLTRAVAFWAKAHDTPCLHIPHAVYHDVENTGLDVHHYITASHIAVSGKYQLDWYAKKGQGRAIITETGLPQFDKYPGMVIDRNAARVALGLPKPTPGSPPIICYASSWGQNTNLEGAHDGVAEWYEAIMESAVLFPEAHFLVKTHPRGGNYDWHKDKFKKYKEENNLDITISFTPHHLDQCLQASDVLLSYGPSNVLLEGSFIPWLRLACTGGYRGDNEIVTIDDDPPQPAKIVATLKAMLSQAPPDYANFRAKYMGACDGRNTEWITLMIDRLSSDAGKEIMPEKIAVEHEKEMG